MTLKQFEKKYNIRFTLNHTGKMEGLTSLSTSVTCNENCIKNASIKNSVCSHCYAARMMKRYKTLEAKLKENTKALTREVIPVEEMPLLNFSIFRFESFGDLNNATQVKNYFNLCYKNPSTTFALWTKNPRLINEAMKDEFKKPSNLIIIVSSLFLNKRAAVNYPFIDKVFTVYDMKTAVENGSNAFINCGSRNCNECRRCYTKTSGVEYINELLK